MNRQNCAGSRIFLFTVVISGVLFYGKTFTVNAQPPTASAPIHSDQHVAPSPDKVFIHQENGDYASEKEAAHSTDSSSHDQQPDDVRLEQENTEHSSRSNPESHPLDSQDHDSQDHSEEDSGTDQEFVESVNDGEADIDEVVLRNSSDTDGEDDDVDDVDDEYDMDEGEIDDDTDEDDEDEEFFEDEYETDFESVANADDVDGANLDSGDFDDDFDDGNSQNDRFGDSEQRHLEREVPKSQPGVHGGHENHDAGKNQGFVAYFKWKDLGTDEAAISVLINGHPAEDVLLHNSTMLSFRIPSKLLRDKQLLATTLVEIRLGSALLASIPLAVLEKVISQVDFNQLRLEVERSRIGDLPTVAPLSSQDDSSSNLKSGSDADSDSETGGAPILSDMDEMLLAADWILSRKNAEMNKRAVRILQEVHEAGNSTATVSLATLYLFAPDGVSRDINLAISLIQNASASGNSDGQALLGFLHASGLALPQVAVDKGMALLLWTLAAEGGSDLARMALAFRHFYGVDLEEDCQKAALYYVQVAEGVVRAAMNVSHPPSSFLNSGRDYKLDLAANEILPPRPFKISFGERAKLEESEVRRGITELREIVEYNQHAADQGEPKAQLIIGTLIYYGDIDLPRDFNRAREYFLNAAKGGRADAHAYVGYIDLMAGRYASAIKYMKKAVDMNERLGMNGMGYVYLRGIGVERNAEIAADYFKSAAELQHPAARYNLAVLYAYGVGVPQSSEIAYELLMEASREDHLLSSYKLGLMLLKGTSPAERNCQKATMFLKRVAEQGMWNKVLYHALRAYERRSYRDALLRYLLAGHCGLDVAQFNAAFMFEHGSVDNGYFNGGWPFGSVGWSGWNEAREGSDESRRETRIDLALDLYQYSAAQGSIDAMVRLGDLAFAEKRDYKRAAAAYEKAVKGRNAEAMFNLGWMHMRGFGMNSDKHMAKRYFDLAIDTEKDAYIPASIALFLMRKSDAILDWWHALQERIQEWQGYGPEDSEDLDSKSAGQDGTSKLNEGKQMPDSSDDMQYNAFVEIVITPDILALTLLLGVLVIVVNARQRRLVRAENDDDGLEEAPVADANDNQ